MANCVVVWTPAKSLTDYIQEQGITFVFAGKGDPNPGHQKIGFDFQTALILNKRCLICGGCLDVCPTQALFGMDLTTTTPPKVDKNLCVGCLNCLEECPCESIVLEKQGKGFCYQEKSTFYQGVQESSEKLCFQILTLAMTHAKQNNINLIIAEGNSISSLVYLLKSEVPVLICFQDRSLLVGVEKFCIENEITFLKPEKTYTQVLDFLQKERS